MKTQDFERIFINLMSKPSNTPTNYSNLPREQKINYLLNALNVDINATTITTPVEKDVEKLSKDVRFQLIQEASMAGNMELVQSLALGKGTANVSVTLPFEKCSITAQLNYLEKEYTKLNEHLPENVTAEILGGKNFYDFLVWANDVIKAGKPSVSTAEGGGEINIINFSVGKKSITLKK